MPIIFESDDLIVVYAPIAGAKTVAITFTPLNQGKQIQKGFAQDVLNDNGFSAICFISKWDHWWQVPSMQAAVDKALTVRHRYGRAITYGTSMGGYGALITSKQLMVNAILAFSPQFSIDRAKVPFERRWKEHAAKISFVDDNLNSGLEASATITLVYDPRSPDAKHVALVQAPLARHIAIPHIGHGAIGFLAQFRMLKPMLISVLNGSEFEQTGARKLRREFAPYWISIADQAISSSRYELAARCLWKALELSPHSYSAARKLGRCCQRLGLNLLAAEWYNYALNIRPSDRAMTDLTIKCLQIEARDAKRNRDGDHHSALQRRISNLIGPAS